MKALKGQDLKESWNQFVNHRNEKAFYTIYSHYFHYLMIIGVKRNFSTSKIKDTIHDVFLDLWEDHIKTSGINNHHNYIITMFLRMLFKKEKLELADLDMEYASFEDISLPSPEDNHIQQITANETTNLVNQLMDQLGEKQRQIIYQRFYLALSPQCIADSNRISINTVYNTLYTAIDKIRSGLSQEQKTYLKVAIGALSTFLYFFLIFQ